MKKIILYLIFIIIILSACSLLPNTATEPDASPLASSDSIIPLEASPEPEARAERFAKPLINEALAAIEGNPRDDLSALTYPFEEEYAYQGLTEEQRQLYSSAADKQYTEDDTEYFEAVCEIVINNMPQEASAYDKYRYLAYFLSQATDYDLRGKSGLAGITPYGTILGGSSVCLGYANTYLYLCEKAGLWCRRVDGYSTESYSSEGGDHSWNLVKLEEGTYYVDITWCDGLDTIGTDKWQSYFMLTEAVLLCDHGVWSGGPASGTMAFN